jgi:two-component system nitrogen regulation response regulator NtrX
MGKSKILVVDDDKTLRDLLADVLQFDGYDVLSAGEGGSALKTLESNRDIELMLLDLVLPDMDGTEVLQRTLATKPGITVVMISGHGSIERAVEATKLGAYDFLEKPLEARRVLITVRNALEASALRKQVQVSAGESLQRYGMIGESRALRRIFALIDVLAPTSMPVLITGKSGTGKELVARALHKNSKRAAAPFVRVNCAAIPDTLIESELFGHEKGAFTDARSVKSGLFQLAHTGTLFLDEIADLSLQAQAKVLLALERGEILRVGGEKYEQVDVRIISASNRNIEEMVTNGTFREDLFYRINVVPLHLPRLCDRPEDILPLARHFLSAACRSNDLEAKELLPDAQAVLTSQKWKGNVRELKNFMEKLAILSEQTRITGRIVDTVLHFPDLETTPTSRETLRQAREAFERSFILTTLRQLNWNITQTAEALGIERSHLYRKMEKLGIEVE